MCPLGAPWAAGTGVAGGQIRAPKPPAQPTATRCRTKLANGNAHLHTGVSLRTPTCACLPRNSGAPLPSPTWGWSISACSGASIFYIYVCFFCIFTFLYSYIIFCNYFLGGSTNQWSPAAPPGPDGGSRRPAKRCWQGTKALAGPPSQSQGRGSGVEGGGQARR